MDGMDKLLHTRLTYFMPRCVLNTHEIQAVADSMSAACLPYEGFPSYYDYLSNLLVTSNMLLHIIIWCLFFTHTWSDDAGGNYYLRYAEKRNKLLKCLESIGMRPCKPEGGMFILSDISNVEVPSKYMEVGTPTCPVMTR